MEHSPVWCYVGLHINDFQLYKRQCIKQESNQSIKQEDGFHCCPHMAGLASIVKRKDPVCIAWKALY